MKKPKTAALSAESLIEVLPNHRDAYLTASMGLALQKPVQRADRPPVTGERMNRFPIVGAITFNVSTCFADLDDERGWSRPADFHSRNQWRSAGHEGQVHSCFPRPASVPWFRPWSGFRPSPTPPTPVHDFTDAGSAGCGSATACSCSRTRDTRSHGASAGAHPGRCPCHPDAGCAAGRWRASGDRACTRGGRRLVGHGGDHSRDGGSTG